jgi:hypothetical protein
MPSESVAVKPERPIRHLTGDESTGIIRDVASSLGAAEEEQQGVLVFA